MNAQVNDLMTAQAIVAQPHQTVEHVRKMMETNKIHSAPVVGPENEVLGIVSTADVARHDLKNGTPISNVMTKKVYTVPRYEGTHIAARVMRNHKIHHLVVTEEQKVVGILSSFDLLKLVEDHRFVMKNPPTESARKGSNRK